MMSSRKQIHRTVTQAGARIERDDFSSSRHLALLYCWSMIPRVEPEGMLFRKPVPTPDQVRDQVRGRLFRDHALRQGNVAIGGGRMQAGRATTWSGGRIAG